MIQVAEALTTGQLVAVTGLLSSAFAAGGAWMAVKKALNGTKERIGRTDETVRNIDGKVDRLLASDAHQNERLASLETKADAHGGWIRRVERIAERREQ